VADLLILVGVGLLLYKELFPGIRATPTKSGG